MKWGRHSMRQALLWLKVSVLIFLLAACSGGGSSSEEIGGGSKNTPKDIVTSQLYSTSVESGNSFYVVDGLATGQFYAIYAYAATANIALYGYVDPDFTLVMCSSDRSGTADEACSTTPDTSGKIYIRISGASGASFMLKVMPAAVGQGSPVAPLDITTSLPYQGTTGHVAGSYYIINNLMPGKMYTVALGNVLYNPVLNVYQRKQFDYAYCTSDNAVWLDESCPVAANFEGKIYIKVSANNGMTLSQIGAYYGISVTPATGTELVFEGYNDAPVDITGKMPYAGQVYRFDSYYKLTGLLPGVRYEVRMNNPTVDLLMYVFQTGTYANAGCTTPYHFGLPTRTSCVATASSSGELYIQIPTLSNGGTYTLDVVLAPVAEGSAASPKVIAVPYNGQVDGTASFYVINGLTPDWNYKVLLGNASRTVTVMAGSSTNLTAYNAISTGRTDLSGSLFIKVDGNATSGNGAWFTLNLGAANNPQGTVAAPLDMTTSTPASPVAGQVDNRTSYYKITGLTAGNYYMAHIGDYTQSVSVYVWDNSTYSGTAKCWFAASPFSSSVANHCLTPAPVSGTLYIEVRGDPSYITGTQYKLWLAPSLLKSEGQLSPVAISVATPYSGKVSNYSTDNLSRYVVSGLPGGLTYNVALSNSTDDVDIWVYSDAAMTAELCHSQRAGLYDESCVATTLSKGGGSKKTLYIAVYASTTSYDGASYILTVTSGATPIVNEGTAAAPIDITASITSYSGKVRTGGNSYYKVTRLVPASRYAIIAQNPNDAVNLYVYADAAFSTVLCADASWFTPVNRSCSTQPNSAGELYVKVVGLSAADANYTLKVAAAPVAVGMTGAPVDITGSLPYSGQVSAGKSYYMVGNLTPGTSYHASLSKLTSKGRVAIYPNSAFTSYTAQSTSNDNVASVVGAADSSGILYVAADGFYSNTHGAFFDLAVRPAPLSEGTIAAPVAVVLKTPYAGQKTYLSATLSYYKITGLVPHSSHRVSLRNRTMSAWVKVFDSASFTRELCYSGYGDFRTGCAAAANTAGEMYIQVGDSGGFYDIYVP